MNIVSESRAFELRAPLRDVLRADPTGDQWAGFMAAMEFVDAGFAVLPVVAGGKAPITWGPFRHGARSASTDRETVRDAFANHPWSNVGIAPALAWIMLDIDPRQGGSLETAESMGLPVDGYRERSGSGGWHLPLVVPAGHAGERSITLGPGLEIKAHGSYVVSPHSRLDSGGWYRPEPGRDVWQWGSISATWPYLHRLKRSQDAASITTGATEQERQTARQVLYDLAHGRYAHQVQLLIAGDWRQVRNEDGSARYPSQSEADLALMGMSVFGAAGNPRVLDAVMRLTELMRPKWDAVHFTPGQTYGQHTILIALASHPSTGSKSPASPPLCLYGTFHNMQCSRADRQREILHFVTHERERDDEGFIKVPVARFAGSLGVDRKTIGRDIGELERAGFIETRVLQPSLRNRERWARVTDRPF